MDLNLIICGFLRNFTEFPLCVIAESSNPAKKYLLYKIKVISGLFYDWFLSSSLSPKSISVDGRIELPTPGCHVHGSTTEVTHHACNLEWRRHDR